MSEFNAPVLQFFITPGQEFDLESFANGQTGLVASTEAPPQEEAVDSAVQNLLPNSTLTTSNDGTIIKIDSNGTISVTPPNGQQFAEGIDEEEVEEAFNGNVGPAFRAVILQEGVDTGDGRFIEPGAVVLGNEGRGDTVPLMFLSKTTEGHDQAVFVGNFSNIFRDGDDIIGEGFFDNPEENEDAAEAIRLVRDEKLNGISADLASMEFEFDVDEDGFIERLRVTKTELGGATIVTIPAFKNARIDIVDSLTASTDIPPQIRQIWPENIDELIANPELEELTAMTYEPDSGRIYGHAFGWKTCHTSHADRCILAPKTKTSYKHFLIGEHAENPVGVITMGTGHAPANYDGQASVEHYDNTGSVAAYVNMGEDNFGAWFSGYVEPNLTDRELRQLTSCGVSGDWRWDDRVRNLELVAVLAVPTPGFQVPRGYMDRSGKQLSLVAAGIVDGTDCLPCQEQAAAQEELGRDSLDRVIARFLSEASSEGIELNSEAYELDFSVGEKVYLQNKLARLIREG